MSSMAFVMLAAVVQDHAAALQSSTAYTVVACKQCIQPALVDCSVWLQLSLLANQVNEFVKRVRAAKIHILIMGHLRKKMPAMMGKQKAQEKLLANLQTEFGMVQREYHLPAGERVH